MAEFVEVMMQASRICNTYKQCDGCPIRAYHNDEIICAFNIPLNALYKTMVVNREAQIMQWANEPPETHYPTWREWQFIIFSDAAIAIKPCAFMPANRINCKSHDKCNHCREQPIPADIAERLGIKPKEA